MAKKAEGTMFLKNEVLFQGKILEKGTEITPDHQEYEDFVKQGRLVSSKALALSKPGAVEWALGETSAELELAKAKIIELESDLEEMAEIIKEKDEAIKERDQEIASLKKASK